MEREQWDVARFMKDCRKPNGGTKCTAMFCRRSVLCFLLLLIFFNVFFLTLTLTLSHYFLSFEKCHSMKIT